MTPERTKRCLDDLADHAEQITVGISYCGRIRCADIITYIVQDVAVVDRGSS